MYIPLSKRITIHLWLRYENETRFNGYYQNKKLILQPIVTSVTSIDTLEIFERKTKILDTCTFVYSIRHKINSIGFYTRLKNVTDRHELRNNQSQQSIKWGKAIPQCNKEAQRGKPNPIRTQMTVLYSQRKETYY